MKGLGHWVYEESCVIQVVCGEPSCRRWATVYTTLEDNPRPWSLDLEHYAGPHEIEPLWYVCALHATAKHKPLPEGYDAPVCERCGKTGGIKWTGGGTAYHYEPTTWDIIFYGPGGLDPNRDSPYCPECAEDYHAHWDEMWKDYRSSIGI